MGGWRENSRWRSLMIAFPPPPSRHHDIAEDRRPRYVAGIMTRGSGVEDSAAPLRQIWYYALPGSRLRPGQTVPRVFLGEPILIGRDRTGAVFALRDLCPHRGIPLSEGRFDGAEVECRFHGWRFDRTRVEKPEKTWIDPDTGDRCHDILGGFGSVCGSF